MIYVLLWVDDLFLIGTPDACKAFTTATLTRFDSHDLGEPYWPLGMAIQRDTQGSLTLSHSRVIVLKYFALSGTIQLPTCIRLIRRVLPAQCYLQ
jgi:hypothetical protein